MTASSLAVNVFVNTAVANDSNVIDSLNTYKYLSHFSLPETVASALSTEMGLVTLWKNYLPWTQAVVGKYVGRMDVEIHVAL